MWCIVYFCTVWRIVAISISYQYINMSILSICIMMTIMKIKMYYVITLAISTISILILLLINKNREYEKIDKLNNLGPSTPKIRSSLAGGVTNFCFGIRVLLREKPPPKMGGLWFSTKPPKIHRPVRGLMWIVPPSTLTVRPWAPKVIWINCSLFRTFCCWFEVSYSFYRCRTTMRGQEEKRKFHLTRNRGNTAALCRSSDINGINGISGSTRLQRWTFCQKKCITKRSASVDIDLWRWDLGRGWEFQNNYFASSAVDNV